MTRTSLSLKWAGNKVDTLAADRVRELFKPYSTTHYYVDLFTGIGGMLTALNPDKAFCIDKCPELIGLHKWLQTLPERFPNGFNHPEFGLDYYELRDEFNTILTNGIEDVDNLLYPMMIELNRKCFQGLWRVNSSGEFNVPEGKTSKKENHNPTYHYDLWSSRYKNKDWTFIYSDYKSVPWVGDTNHFIYADPPYFRTFSSYTQDGFTREDHIELARFLANQKCPVVTSNSSEIEILELYTSHGFTIELIPVRKPMKPTKAKRPAKLEMLAYKNISN